MRSDEVFELFAEDYRYRLLWRRRLLAGYGLASGVLGLVSPVTAATPLRWAAPLVGLGLSIACLLFEERGHELLRLARRRVSPEHERGQPGLSLAGPDITDGVRPTSPRTLYILGALAFLVLIVVTIAR